MEFTNEPDYHAWLTNWIATASEEELRSKFKEVMPYLDGQDIAYIFYNAITENYPEEQIDALLQ